MGKREMPMTAHHLAAPNSHRLLPTHTHTTVPRAALHTLAEGRQRTARQAAGSSHSDGTCLHAAGVSHVYCLPLVPNVDMGDWFFSHLFRNPFSRFWFVGWSLSIVLEPLFTMLGQSLAAGLAHYTKASAERTRDYVCPAGAGYLSPFHIQVPWAKIVLSSDTTRILKAHYVHQLEYFLQQLQKPQLVKRKCIFFHLI